MITELVKQWEENKHKLAEYFKTTKQDEYDSYETIVKKVFEICIPKATDCDGWDLEKMTVIDHGEYQGTQIFIIPTDTYQPDVEDYVMTDTYYGSCSGCDTLQAINDYSGFDDLPTDGQVKEYMTLALHLVQKIKRLGT
jgi:hypothetical protein